MPRSATRAIIAQAEFRMHRAEEAMAEAIERLRSVTEIPGYHGLDIADVEQVASLVGRTRAAIAEWGNEVAARRPRSILHATERRPVTQSPPERARSPSAPR